MNTLTNSNQSKLYICTSELLKRYGITKCTLINWRNNRDFPQPIVKAHGRSNSRYGVKAVATWEENNGMFDALSIDPLLPTNSRFSIIAHSL
ncbi:hypothetical protein [Acinetobacter gerneri]|uniref:DNA-binding protein n=1 Tax=Acinetobacter gerneri DSM 14967 = CIP 107464 = MTCC 9824 TaxID=1120926 RepID=N8ZHD9_9GAMM|nr:hypothetical protein F960_02881 [Acinetobacter gerneri DSM 14967 = CIP 107464 = MTCC 9824]